MESLSKQHQLLLFFTFAERIGIMRFSDYLFPFPRRVYKFIPHQAWVNTIVTIQGKKVDQRLDITRCLLNF
jgi:hypothetical protein